MVDQDEDIEFIPSDEIVETERPGAEEEAVHDQESEQPKELMMVEAEEFDAELLDETEADELEREADEEAEEAEAEAEEEAEAGPEEEREEDLEEVVRRHFGLIEEEPEEEITREVGELREPQTGEFVCQSCFLRKSISQLSDPERRICIDCAANSAR